MHVEHSTHRRALLKFAVTAISVAAGAFAILGTFAALWENPFFVRMTATSGFEIGLLALQSILLGAYVAIPARGCRSRPRAWAESRISSASHVRSATKFYCSSSAPMRFSPIWNPLAFILRRAGR